MFARKVKRGRWLNPPPRGHAAGADVLQDLQTDGNELSVWKVAEDRSDLGEVIVALASILEPTHLDLMLIPESELRNLDISWIESEGQTFYEPARERHVDLIDLGAQQLAQLAERLRPENVNQIPIVRIREKDVLSEIRQRVWAGTLNFNELKERTRSALSG